MSAYSIATRGLAGRKVPQGVLATMDDLLFSGSEPGAWYDPADLSTLFQDSAFTVPVTAVEQPVGGFLDKSGRGNHASQATATARGKWSARVNRLTQTENLTHSDWIYNANITVAASGIASPVGTAFKITPTAVSGTHTLQRVVPGRVASVYLKNAGYNFAQFYWAGGRGTINLTTGGITNSTGPTMVAVDVGDGWWRCHIDIGAVANTTYFAVSVEIAAGVGTFTGDGTSGVHVAGLQVENGAVTRYQRVTSDTDYDTVGFPHYLKTDGIDDYYTIATGGGGSAGFFFSSVISPLGSAGTNRTLFSDAGTNTGYIVRLNASDQLELAAGNGTAYTTIATAGTLAVGASDVVQAWDDGANLNVQIGTGPTASIARPAVVAGTAGYTLGQDNGASSGYFNGRIYGEIYRKDSSPTHDQREAVALYQRQKAKLP